MAVKNQGIGNFIEIRKIYGSLKDRCFSAQTDIFQLQTLEFETSQLLVLTNYPFQLNVSHMPMIHNLSHRHWVPTSKRCHQHPEIITNIKSPTSMWPYEIATSMLVTARTLSDENRLRMLVTDYVCW